MFSSLRSQHVLTTYTYLKGLSCSSQTNMCRSRDCTTARTYLEFQQIFRCKGCHWEGLLGKQFLIHLPMTVDMLLGPLPMDLVAEHSARMPPDDERGKHFIECLICRRQRSQFWCTATLWPIVCPYLLEWLVNGVHLL